MVHFVGAGPGAPDLITVRGQKLLGEADVIIYAGSLVNPQLLSLAKEGCAVYNSAVMTLEEVTAVMAQGEKENKTTVRLHTGDPSIYGAIREQIDWLEQQGIPFDVTPGVSSFCGGAAALSHLGGAEYTLPEVSQTVIITRMAGRTPVPQEESIEKLAAHKASMVVFLSSGMIPELSRRLMAGGYSGSTPAAIVYKATWPEEKTIVGTVEQLPALAAEHNITKTALIMVGDYLGGIYERSKLYDPNFTTEYRQAAK